jgi:iron complex transport system permease protein
MKNSLKIALGAACAAAVIGLAGSLGSSAIPLKDTARIVLHRLFRVPLGAVAPGTADILWLLRLPRVLLAFLTGGSLAVSGAVFQSALRNQLASPYILGVSSGASLGAALVMAGGVALPVLGAFTLPASGFAFGVGTVFLVIAFSAKIDPALSNNTVILAGMVFSLFVNAVLTILTALFREELKTLVIWQMGSFSLRGWQSVRLLLPFFVIGTAGLARYARELDLLTFGEDAAKTLGVDAPGVKKRVLLFGSVLTGSAVALSGAIGFVDLIAPHIARRIVGPRHRAALPMSFLIGGCLLVLSDLIARTVLSPSELPVGAVTALIGAPFFAWVYFRKKRG